MPKLLILAQSALPLFHSGQLCENLRICNFSKIEFGFKILLSANLLVQVFRGKFSASILFKFEIKSHLVSNGLQCDFLYLG